MTRNHGSTLGTYWARGAIRFSSCPALAGRRASWWYQRNRPTTAPPTGCWSCGGDHYVPICYFLYIYSPSGCATAASYFHLTFLVHLPFCVCYSPCSELVFRFFSFCWTCVYEAIVAVSHVHRFYHNRNAVFVQKQRTCVST